jgi:UDP-GlcNAc3NAcA epimerase
MKKKIRLVTIVGARPQFVKAAVVTSAIEAYNHQKHARRLEEVLVHTGQHYDFDMSQVFFKQLGIPAPHYHLGVGSGRHGEQTAKMMVGIEEVLLKECPDFVIVYGDTNSTLAGALTAAKLNIRVAHVEAGLRSFNRVMPEELNRIVTDRLSTLLFCPTDISISNLKNEGIHQGAHQVGDVMLDAFLAYKKAAIQSSNVLETHDLKDRSYCLATVHRQENTDDPSRLLSIFSAFSALADAECPLIVPLHPRTRKSLLKIESRIRPNRHVKLTLPFSYLDMIVLISQAKTILTDSGGVQREAYFARVPCVTVRDETEWTETVESGWNIIAGTQTKRIIQAFKSLAGVRLPVPPPYFGDGKASRQIVKILSSQIT